MSNERHETVADIVDDIRAQNQGLPEDSYALSPLVCDLLSIADRIEAAHRREREAGAEAAQICGEISEMVGIEAACHQPVTDCNGLNEAAMREALENVRFYLPHFLQWMRLHCEDAETGGYYEKILEVVNAALSALPRNCDRPECATTKSAQDTWRKEDGGKTAYYEWLLATSTKGEANGSK